MFLVTGANGFVGQNVCKTLINAGCELRAASRSGTSFEGADNVVFDMASDCDFSPYLQGIDVIIHLAARAHQLTDRAANPIEAFRRVNRDAALRLLAAAAKTGVRRFVYVSSIGVNGNETAPGRPFRESDRPCPRDAYAVSKYEAECELTRLSASYGVELVIVRPPLVYGPGAPGNFGRLLRLVNTGLPLPLGSVTNMRSFVFVNNLVDALIACAKTPEAASKTFLVSDSDDISTPALISAIAAMQEKPVRLIAVPPRLVRLILQVVGKADLFDKLTNSLQVDSSSIQVELGWHPPFSLLQGLRATFQSLDL